MNQLQCYCRILNLLPAQFLRNGISIDISLTSFSTLSYLLLASAFITIGILMIGYVLRKMTDPENTTVYLLFGAVMVSTGIMILGINFTPGFHPTVLNQVFTSITGILSWVFLLYFFKYRSADFFKRQEVKKEQRKNEERLRLLVEEVTDYAIFMIDPEGIVITWNKGAETIKGYTADEIIGKHISVFYTPEDVKNGNAEYLLKETREKGRYADEVWRVKKDGTGFWANIVLTALYDEQGNFYGYSKVTKDVTQKKKLNDLIISMNEDLAKQVEEKTKEISASEKRFRALVENSQDSIILFNEKFESVFRSIHTERLKGTLSEEKETLTIFSQTHPDDIESVKQITEAVLLNPGKPFWISLRTLHRDGYYIYAEGYITNMLDDENVKLIVSNMRDVSDRKKIELDLQKTLKELTDYKYALDESSLVSITNAEGVIVTVNESFCRHTGFSESELLGKNHLEFLATHNKKEYLETILQKVSNGNVWKGEILNETKQGQMYWVFCTIVPFLDETGKPHQYITIRTDITEQKLITEKLHELNNQLEYRVEQRTKELNEANHALESFSYSVSHDLRAPLRVIDGYGDILLEDHSDQLDEEAKQTLLVIRHNVRKMGGLIDALLNLSRLGRKELLLRKVNMNEIVKEITKEQLLLSGRKVTLHIDELLPATGDKELLHHVWSNLISNAIKYSSKVPDPLIQISSRLELSEVIYSVKDNGVGFDMKYYNKLFGVFQRLHKMSDYDGTGIGLALVQRIITKNHGRVWAESEVNNGATFFFSLPAEPVNVNL